MKKVIMILTVILFAQGSLSAQGSKIETIFDSYFTHTKLSAYIFYENGKISKEEIYYTVTDAAMWTGKLSTTIIYHGTPAQMVDFLEEILQFAEKNKNQIGVSTIIEERKISMTKKIGIKLITIRIGKKNKNTTYKDLQNALKMLKEWVKNNSIKQ